MTENSCTSTQPLNNKTNYFNILLTSLIMVLSWSSEDDKQRQNWQKYKRMDSKVWHYLKFMLIKHVNPLFLYKLLKPPQEIQTLLTYLKMIFKL